MGNYELAPIKSQKANMKPSHKYSTNDPETDVILKTYSALEELPHNPRFLVLVTHGLMELCVNILIEESCPKHGKNITARTRDFPHSVKLKLLNEMDIISDETYQWLDWLRNIRNKAVHEADFLIAEKDLEFWRSRNPAFCNPSSFHFMCLECIAHLLNRHPSIEKKLSPWIKQGVEESSQECDD